jgi:hypothetical protein
MSQRPIKLPVFRELERLLRSLGLRQPVLYYPQNQGTEITVVWESRLLYLEA